MLRPLIKLRARGALVTLLLCGAPQLAAGQQIPAPPLRYQIGWQDAAVTGGALALTAIPTLLAEQLPHASCAPCDPNDLWAIDRRFVGEPLVGLGRASNATLMAALFAGGVLTLDAHAGDPTDAKWEDLAVYAQALSVNAALTAWSKVLFHRARPPRYTANAAAYPEADQGLSFPSGHSSTAFAAAAAYTSMLSRRRQVGAHVPEVVLMFGAATATAVLRVAAHKHFPTDVVAGAVLGTAVGWVIPQLHPIQ
jgi:membrane-associated phospholipid phosphatase